MTKRQKTLLQGFFSLILLAGLLLWVDVQETLRVFQTVRWPAIVAAFVLITFNRILMPLKWNLLLRAKGIHQGWMSCIRIYYISTFLGLYLPPTIGQDAIRAYYVARARNPLRDVVATILIERLIGLIALMLFATTGGVLFVTYFRETEVDVGNILQLIVLLTVLSLLGFLSSFTHPFRTLVTRTLDLLGKIPGLGGMAPKLDRLFDSYFSMRDRKGTLLVFFLLTGLEVSLPIVRSYIIGIALGVTVPLLYYFAFVPIILVLIRLPLSLDGFGIQEGGFVYFLSLVGVDKAVGFSVGLLNHLIFLVAVLPGWYFYVTSKEKDRVVQEAEAAGLSSE